MVRVGLTPEGEAKAAELVAVAARYEARVLARHPRAVEIRAVLREIVAGAGAPPLHRGGAEDAAS